MLFDLRGRRRRAIQVIYVFLALLLGGGLVFAGIGGDAPGGLLDAFGLGSGHTGSTDPRFDEDIERAEARLAEDPDNRAALLTLARTNYVAGNSALEVDERGFAAIDEEVRSRFEASVEAWERYLDTDPPQPDSSVANVVFQAYDRLASSSTQPSELEGYLQGAQRTADIIAEERPSANAFFQLAAYSYFDGDVKAGDAAADRAVREAQEENAGEDAIRSLERQLEQVKQQGKSLQQQFQADRPGQEDLENPLGGLGGAGAGATELPGGGGAGQP